MAKKRNFIEVSESESCEPESDDEGVMEINSSTSSDHGDSDDDSDSEDADGDSVYDYDGDDDGRTECKGSIDEEEDEGRVDIADEESVCNKVIQSIRGKSHLIELKLVECRVFLRRHGLRLSGNKEECTERINEFLRLKDGNGEAFYPRSSFIIDCTGDVCKGDVVLFTQKVYKTSDKMKRHGSAHGSRTIAGRIVKESYGAARQQHTFTVEVLWSKGTNRLAPLAPLLVKGRNLYKRKTFRQRWENEKNRLVVLGEKHQRGAAARTVRDMRRNKFATNTNKSSTSKGAKHHKHSHNSGSSQAKPTKDVKNGVNKRGKALGVNKKLSPRKNFPPFRASSSNQARHLTGPASCWRGQNMMQENQIREVPYLPYNYPSQNFYPFQLNNNPRGPHHFPCDRDSLSVARLSHPQPFPNPVFRPISQNHEINHSNFVYPAYPQYSHHANDSRFPGSMEYRFPHLSYTDTYRWR